ncbi:MipA/OmpV family protein [Kosakonia oryzendophytica]|uniref:MipA/OmpV family protein n=1 Tax=Kosakonia oryzendophytica TaxID=1005665 RepID=UPI000777BEDF|nr:MipA/OmpV family protein [Kosakonia oryzendophytica]WBT60618.1 MipA/OmpV family protein [Kosakonia oryzendophytica]
MIMRKNALYMIGSLLPAFMSGAYASDATVPQDTLTLGLGGQYAPQYSGSDKYALQIVPVIQARKGAFFLDTEKGVGYDLQTADGLYLEHTLGYNLGRADSRSAWRDGADNLKGMGTIDAVLNTALAVGWSVTPWLTVEGKATLPLTDSQGVQYQTSVTLLPVQSAYDTVAIQSAMLFGDSRYMNIFYGVNRQQSLASGYSRYSAKGGMYGIETRLIWSHQFDAHWGTTFSAGYHWLDSAAADSPIVLRRNEGSTVAAFTYTF